MKNFIIAFLVFLVWSFFGLWLYTVLQPDNPALTGDSEVAANNTLETDKELESLENMKETQTDSILITKAYEEEPVATSTQGLKALSETGDIIFYFPEGFKIVKNSSRVEIPAGLIDFKYKLNTYFVEHPNTELHITSQYSPGENIETPNLGIKRGQYLKQILAKAGIPSQRIVIKPHITQIEFQPDNTYRHSFSFSFKPLNDKRVSALKYQMPEDRVVYPNFSSQGIWENEDLRLLAKDISEILIENPNLHITVIGHTDNIGNAIDNYRQGLEYARQVRWYLVNKTGIDRNRISADSKGESELIAGNDTERERNINRRIEINFYQDTYE